MQTRRASIKETGEELSQAEWERFDAAVGAHNLAIAGSNAAAVADAFGELSASASQLAEVVAREDEVAGRAHPSVRGAA